MTGVTIGTRTFGAIPAPNAGFGTPNGDGGRGLLTYTALKIQETDCGAVHAFAYTLVPFGCPCAAGLLMAFADGLPLSTVPISIEQPFFMPTCLLSCTPLSCDSFCASVPQLSLILSRRGSPASN
jgi:hypothetical protein